jgi:TRAP-type C4-dicarboxylate transport system permease small subunit
VVALIERGLAAAETAFLAAANGLLLAMLAINVLNIGARAVFDTAVIWVFPVTGVLFVWMIFAAFFVIYRRGQDVAIDVLTHRLPPRGQALAEAFVALIALGLMALILAQAPVLIPKQVGVIDMVGIQRYWLAVPFFASCLLIAVEFALRLRTAVLRLRAPAMEPDARP